MGQMETTVDLDRRYCPTCRLDTYHAVRMVVRPGYSVPEEVSTACGVCNAGRFWDLRMAQDGPVAAEPVKVFPGVT